MDFEQKLHKYYMDTGFEPCGECSDPAYPSGALFQKPISVISKPIYPLFTELSPSSSLPTTANWSARGDLDRGIDQQRGRAAGEVRARTAIRQLG